MAVKITDKEAQALKGIIDSDFRDGDHPTGRPVWTWSANPFPNKRSFSGVVTSLVNKGLVISTDEGEDSIIQMEKAGLEAYEAHIGKAWDAE